MSNLLHKIFSTLDMAYGAAMRVRQRFADASSQGANRRTIVIIVLAGLMAIAAYLFFIRPPDDFPAGQLVTVPAHSSILSIAGALQKDGVIRSRVAFILFAEVVGKGRELRAGDYIFKEPVSLFSVVRRIAFGTYGLEPLRIRIPEGATTREMSVIYGSQLQRFNQVNFLAQAQPIEGYLFPDTYYFLPNATESTVIATMKQNFDTHLASATPMINTFASSTGYTLHDVITMASILEREARYTEDRRMISGVLWNRIHRGMALQVDVTFLYTLGKNTFQLTRKDLQTQSPYNTYVNKGLPPGPIGSPSLDSIIAAVTPTKSSYLFYLADSSGVTHYSKTYQQHLIKKDTYINN